MAQSVFVPVKVSLARKSLGIECLGMHDDDFIKVEMVRGRDFDEALKIIEDFLDACMLPAHKSGIVQTMLNAKDFLEKHRTASHNGSHEDNKTP